MDDRDTTPGFRRITSVFLVALFLVLGFLPSVARAGRRPAGGVSPPGAHGRIVDPNAPAWAHASAGAVPGSPTGAPEGHSASGSWLRGIDVSHWQGTINWPKVAASGRRFVIMKATDGRTYVDPTYATNKARATAAGLAVGAYHFARPDTRSGDAVAEADHYMAAAALGPGNIIPVLDLEERTSMPASTRIAWALAWLKEVRRKLHVHPMVYSGPNFWQTYMDDTPIIAEKGYPLWLAHWTTGTPTVPAGNWAGHGWRVWQWSNCGSVPGISGCVDQDRLGGLSLNRVRIPLLTVSRTASGTVTSVPRGIDCGGTCRSVFDPRSGVTLTAAPGPDGVLVRWGGACSGSAECSVTMAGNRKVRAKFGYPLSVSVTAPGLGSVQSDPAGITCPDACAHPFVEGSSVTLTAVAAPGSQFSGWSGDCTGSADCTVSMDGPRSVTANFGDDTPPSAVLRPPHAVTGAARASFSEVVHGVSVANFVERVAGRPETLTRSLTCLDASGTAVDCFDGDVVQASLRPSAPRVPGQTYELEVDPSSADPIRDRGGNPVPPTSATFRAATSVEDGSRAVEAQWRTVWNPNALGGSYRVEHLRGAGATYAFTGSSVTWYSVAGPSFGKAKVRVDGDARGTFNLHAATTRFEVSHAFTGLGPGSHRISVSPLGTPGAPGGGTAVAVDAFKAGGVVDPRPRLEYRWATHESQKASGGSYRSADLKGASLRFHFRGTAVDWRTVLGPAQGRSAVSVDGQHVGVVDGYAAVRTFGVARHIGGLTDAVHVLRIVVLGTKRRASHGTSVSIDAFHVT